MAGAEQALKYFSKEECMGGEGSKDEAGGNRARSTDQFKPQLRGCEASEASAEGWGGGEN